MTMPEGMFQGQEQIFTAPVFMGCIFLLPSLPASDTQVVGVGYCLSLPEPICVCPYVSVRV